MQRALRLEEVRKRGAEALRQYALRSCRDVAERLQEAGHKILHQELLDAYPPCVRIHLTPTRGPLDEGEEATSVFELIWGEPDPQALCARRLSSTGADRVHVQGSARPGVLDELWVKEQIITFVRETLESA